MHVLNSTRHRRDGGFTKSNSGSRLHLLQLAVVLGFLTVLVRLYYWQIIKGPELSASAQLQRSSIVLKQAGRGSIYSSDGYALATNQDSFILFVEPKKLENSVAELQSVLSPLLAQVSWDEAASPSGELEDYEREWSMTIDRRLSNTTRSWVAIKHNIPIEIADQIQSLELGGVGLQRTLTRFYPDASVAAHLLGFVGKDEQGNDKGYFGVEGSFDLELQPITGVVQRERDARGLAIPIGGEIRVTEKNGRDVVLTIRRDLQYLLEQELLAGMERYGSKTAEAVILDPTTGDILALASYPSYDPSKFAQFPPNLYRSPLISDLYEPGSTLKILTVAAGIDSGAIEQQTVCTRCAGSRTIAGFTIKTWNDQYKADRTMLEGLAASDNTAMIYIMEEVGITRFTEYLQAFRLHLPSELGFGEEARPQFRDQWRLIDGATASFGQGIAINGLQMALVAQAIANDGEMMRPRIVRKVRDGDLVIPREPQTFGQVISSESAREVTEMMIESVVGGDARWAVPDDIAIAGKTGTAQIPIAGHYDAERTIASFVGFAPAQNPRFVMLVKLQEPTTSPWGSETAAPLWFSIANKVLNLL